MTDFEIWRGFRHEWLRTAFGFRTPHRISKLASFIDDGHFVMGQNTGVDGNYMKPVGRMTHVSTDNVHVVNGCVALQWTDAASSTHPSASSSLAERIERELSSTADEVGVLLRGFDLSTSCDPDKQVGTAGNSDGMWPYRFFVSVGSVALHNHRVSFDVDVDIARGWTPNRGGVPFLEEKPFNSHLDFRLEVFYTVVAGSSRGFRFTRLGEARFGGMARDEAIQAKGLRASRTRPGPATVGLTGIGFELERYGSSARFEHRGRYLGTLDFGVEGIDRHDHMDVRCRGQVWVPVTVWNAPVRYSIETALLEFEEADVRHEDVLGSICCPSQGAPWWSAWDRCEDDLHGPSRRMDRVRL